MRLVSMAMAAFAAMSLPCALALPAQDCDDSGEAKGDPAVIKQLRVEINALNLMNGLHLTVEQVEALLQGARRNRELRAEHLGDVRDGDESAAKARYEALLELKKALDSGQTPDEKALKALREKFEPKGGPPRPALRPDRGAYARQLKAIEKRIEETLLESQKEVIATFKPCLIPPKNLKDPVRVGQASDHSREGEALTRLRTLPQAKWDRVKNDVLETMISKWEEKHGRFAPEQRKAEMAEAMAVAEEARGLSEVEFQMRKEELAERVSFESRKDEIHKQLSELEDRKHDAPGKVANILLDPQIIPVLERRLQQMKGFTPDKPTDLEGIAGADTCKDGKCGKKMKD